jgi:NADPH2:quinone reductase
MQNSIKIGFPKYSDSLTTRADLLARSGELFDWIQSGALNITIGREYPLADAARAHADLESRMTTGKLLLRA